jgi:cytochrome P450
MSKDAYDILNGPKQGFLLGNALQVDVKRLHQNLEDWADEFGGIYKIRLGPSKHIVITDPDLMQEIMRERPEKFRRMEKMDNIFKEKGVHGVFNAEGEEWKVHRKLVAQGLDVRHQQQFFPAILKTTQRLLNKWKQLATSHTPFDVQKDLVRYTVDVTTSLAFGYEMNTVEMGEDVIQNHLEKVFPTIFKRINAPIPWWRYFKTKADREFDYAFEQINLLVNDFIKAGRTKLEKHPELREKPTNFLEAMLVEAENEPAIDDKAIHGNLLTILMAGEDTTAHTVAWMVYFLSQYPEWQEKIREEVEPYLKDGVVTDYRDLLNLKTIEAVANETMRLKPVAPLLLFEPLEDVEVKGYHFKKGRKLLFETRFAATDSTYFGDPKEFNPNRWLAADKCPHLNHELKAFIPFGSGPRFCPGRNLAFTEIKMMVAMLCANFHLKITTDINDIEEIMAFTMLASSYNIVLEERKIN